MSADSGVSIIDIVIIVLAVPAICGGVLFIFRYTTYWYRLERLYLCRDAVIEYDVGWQPYISFSTPVAPSLFNNFRLILAIGVNRTGMVIRALWPTRWCFRTLQIPWEEFSIADTEFEQVLPYEIFMPKLPQVQIRVSRETGDNLIQLGATYLTLRVTPQS